MKKYAINISGLTTLEFTLPVLKGRKSEILSKLLLTLGNIALFLFLTSLPLSGLISGKALEQGSFIWLVLFMSICLGSFGAFLLLQGRKALVDPKNFLAVLLFALLTTAASVLKSPAHVSNTFGIESLRSLSGISVMGLIGLFYFTNLVTRDSIMLSKIFKTLSLSFSIFILVAVLHTNASDLTFVNNNLSIVIFAYLFLLLNLYFVGSRRIIKSILLAVSAVFIFLTPQTVPNPIISTKIITVTLLSFLILTIVYAILEKNLVQAKIKELRSINTKFKDKKYSLSELSYFLLISVSMIAILIGILVHFRFNLTSDIIAKPFEGLLNAFRAPFTSTFNLTKALIGNGAYDAIRKTSNLSTNVSSLTNVIFTQGLVGSIAYIFIFITAIYTLVKAIKKSLISKSNRSHIFVLAFTLLFASILSVLSYAGEFFAIVWWLSFALISAFLALDSKKVFEYNQWSVSTLMLKGRAGVYLRVTLAVAIIAFAIFAIVSFSRISV